MIKYLAVIPARAGSKGIKYKNIYPVKGQPLITYTLDIANQLASNIDVVVSTDFDRVKEIVRKYERITIIERPRGLAEDEVRTEEVLIHALDYMKNHNDKVYDAVITLQPTSPLRSLSTLEKSIKFFEEDTRHNALLSLTETYEDYWIKKDEEFHRLQNNAPRRRQERAPLFIENGVIYITGVAELIKTKSVLGTRTNGIVIPARESVDINYIEDIKYVEALLND